MVNRRVQAKARKNTTLPNPAFTLGRSHLLQRNPDENDRETIQTKSCGCSGKSRTLPSVSHSFGQVSAHGSSMPRIRAKLTIGQPNDQYEQEADRVADQVMRMPEPKIQRVCAECKEELQRQPMAEEEKKENEETLQTKPLAESITPLIQRQTEPTEEEKEEATLQTKTAFGKASTVSPALQSQITAFQGGGQPLPESERRFFEPRFGADFSQVRVHSGSQAAEAARAINARAFTLGRDVIFGAGEYQPQSSEGQRLLAHELTHVVQQGATGLASKTVQRNCGSEAIGAPTGCEETVGDLSGLRYLFKVNCDEFARGNDLDLEKDAEKIDDKATVEIHGLASVDGDSAYNKRLSCARAIAAKTRVEKVLSRRKVTATIRLFSHGAQKGNKTTMRSVVMAIQNPAPHKAVDCPSAKGFKASTLEDYVDLIKCLETSTTLDNRNVLALLRQMYYGKSWSATSQTELWDKVIPCSTNPGDPRKLIHADLFEALHNSVDVQGTDVGHIFTGLESMMCPSNEVKINTIPIVSDIMDDIANVKMSNEQFATWGGDLGAAVAAMAACWFMDDADRSKAEDCRGADLTQGLLAFLKIQAPDEDLEGDILPFVLRANAMGINCSGSLGQKLSLSAPISQLFVNFMKSKDATGNANRYACFTEVIGGQIAGGQIQNKDALVKAYYDPVLEFAKTFYVKIMTDVYGKMPPHRVVPFGDTIPMMERQTPLAIRYFLAWLENRMPPTP